MGGASRGKSTEQPPHVHLHTVDSDDAAGLLPALVLCVPALAVPLPVRLAGRALGEPSAAAASAPGEGSSGGTGPCLCLPPWTFMAVLPVRVPLGRILL